MHKIEQGNKLQTVCCGVEVDSPVTRGAAALLTSALPNSYRTVAGKLFFYGSQERSTGGD